MDFNVSQSIQSFGGHLHMTPYVTYSSVPAQNQVNPGINVQLYSDIVPLHSGFQNLHHKNENQSLPRTDNSNQDIDIEQTENQTGSGLDPAIQKSFQNPRPIKTEVLEVFEHKEKTSRKRKKDETKGEPKSKSVKHKFQLV